MPPLVGFSSTGAGSAVGSGSGALAAANIFSMSSWLIVPPLADFSSTDSGLSDLSSAAISESPDLSSSASISSADMVLLETGSGLDKSAFVFSASAANFAATSILC